MNFTRIAILSVAAVAAGAAAFLARGMLGGGTAPAGATVQAPQASTADVLVATADVEAGRAIAPAIVHWQAWPKNALSPLFITRDEQPDIVRAVERAYARAPLIAGEPLTTTKIVRADSASFMAATLTPGKRAVSIAVTAESSAGGFILPNDRVDVILTREIGDGTPRIYKSETILGDVRVLAIDQAPKPLKDAQAAVGKTATLELSMEDAELIAQAKASGALSLSLRSLGDDSPLAQKEAVKRIGGGPEVTVIRYGVRAVAAVNAAPPNTSSTPARPE